LANQGALSRLSEKHGSTGHAVCVIEPVDGAKTVNDRRRGASVMQGIERCEAPFKGKTMHLKVEIGPIFGLRRCFLNNRENG
jgi:hypothetical protein